VVGIRGCGFVTQAHWYRYANTEPELKGSGFLLQSGMFLRAKFDGLLTCSMHPIAVQAKLVAAAEVGLYPESLNKERISLSLGRIQGH
jgi:hypothetical protein